jgi:actin-related protein
MSNGFIVNIGATFTYAIPLMEGKVLFNEIRRINVGTSNIFDYLSKNLVNKYAHIRDKLHILTTQMIYNQYNHCALDYKAQ